MNLTIAAFVFFSNLFCDGYGGGHISTNIRMTFPRNAFNICGVDVFFNFVLRWHWLRSHHNNYPDDVSMETFNNCGVDVFLNFVLR